MSIDEGYCGLLFDKFISKLARKEILERALSEKETRQKKNNRKVYNTVKLVKYRF